MVRLFRWVLILDVMLVNFAVGYLFYKSSKVETPGPKFESSTTTQVSNTKTEYVDQCGKECQSYIDSKIALITPVPTQRVTTTYVAPVRTTKTRSTTYVTVPGSGYSTSNDWTALSGTDFYFDTRDYPGLVEVYFEANIKLFNGNGVAYVRLYDSTNGVGVQGSDIQTSSQADVLVTSGKLNFWSGKNLIRVQARSLTADTAVFSSGRLRIVTEN